MASRTLSAAAFAVCILLAATSFAEDPRPLLDLEKAKGNIPPGWEIKEKEGTAKFHILRDGDKKALCLNSKGSSFSLQRKIKVDVKRFPYMVWRWKVTELPRGADFRDDKKDDQAAQIFVAFGGKSISYIWDTAAPVGSQKEFYIPMVMTVKIVVVESGEGKKDKWVTEVRNVYEDYKRLYGKEPDIAEGLRYQINSQYTGTPAGSCLESVEFRKTPPPPETGR